MMTNEEIIEELEKEFETLIGFRIRKGGNWTYSKEVVIKAIKKAREDEQEKWVNLIGRVHNKIIKDFFIFSPR